MQLLHPNPKTERARPSFFWQGLLLVLPVLVLAVVGLISLRQDEQATEQTARKKAAENAVSLGRTMSISAGDQLAEFLDLQSAWMDELRKTASGSTNVRDPGLAARIARWESDYPGLQVADLAVPSVTLSVAGVLVSPPGFSPVPTPPPWFLELTPAQRQTWQALRESQSTDHPTNDLAALWKGFLDAHPSEEAQQAASNYDLLDQPQVNLASCAGLTESGLPFTDLMCWQILDHPSGTMWQNSVLDQLERDVSVSPSFLTSALFTKADEHPPANPSKLGRLRAMEKLWEKDSLCRAWLQPLRSHPELLRSNVWLGPPEQNEAALTVPVGASVGNNGPTWNDAVALGSAVVSTAVFGVSPKTLPGETPAKTPETLALPNPTTASPPQNYTICFASRVVIEAIFARALAENQFLVPDYAVPIITVAGVPLDLANDLSLNSVRSHFPGLDLRDEKNRLASATQALAKIPQASALNFNVALYLTSREKMLAGAQVRERLFGALIAGAVLASLIGLVTARRAFHQQHRLSEMKTDFVSSVSHELRAPIASLRLLAEGLERGKISEPAKKQEYYRFLVQESRRLTSLIENVLDFSRIEQGRKEYQFELTDLDAMVDQTVKLMLPAAAEKRVELVWRPGAAPPVSCDGLAIQQALINLIDNSIKHSPPGATVTVGCERGGLMETTNKSRQSHSPSPPQDCRGEGGGEEARSTDPHLPVERLTDKSPPLPNPLLHKCVEAREPESFSIRRSDIQSRGPASGRVHLWVEDQGPGIPAEEHEKIFERFYRRGSELRRETQGIGIGLTIVKHIVEAHGGCVLVRSAPGQGSRFTLELPTTPP